MLCKPVLYGRVIKHNEGASENPSNLTTLGCGVILLRVLESPIEIHKHGHFNQQFKHMSKTFIVSHISQIINPAAGRKRENH